MSWRFVKDVYTYTQMVGTSTPEALRRLSNQMRMESLQRFPIDTSFEPMRGPVHDLTQPQYMFTIADDNLFFMDLVEGSVLSAKELRARYFALLSQPYEHTRSIVWLLTDAYTNACKVLLHFSREEVAAGGYELHTLFLSQEELHPGSRGPLAFLSTNTPGSCTNPSLPPLWPSPT